MIRFVAAHRAFNASREQRAAVLRNVGAQRVGQPCAGRAARTVRVQLLLAALCAERRVRRGRLFGARVPDHDDRLRRGLQRFLEVGNHRGLSIVGCRRPFRRTGSSPTTATTSAIAGDAKRLVDELSLLLAEGMLDPAFKVRAGGVDHEIPGVTAPAIATSGSRRRSGRSSTRPTDWCRNERSHGRFLHERSCDALAGLPLLSSAMQSRTRRRAVRRLSRAGLRVPLWRKRQSQRGHSHRGFANGARTSPSAAASRNPRHR